MRRARTCAHVQYARTFSIIVYYNSRQYMRVHSLTIGTV